MSVEKKAAHYQDQMKPNSFLKTFGNSNVDWGTSQVQDEMRRKKKIVQWKSRVSKEMAEAITAKLREDQRADLY